MNRAERRRIAAEEARARKRQAKRDRREGILRLTRLVIDRRTFDGIPEEERTLLILAGRVTNDLNTLSRLSLWCYNGASVTAGTTADAAGVTSFARFCQAFLLLKVFIGRLWEGWQLLQKSFFGAGLSKEYERLLPAEAAEGLRAIKRIFSSSTGLSVVRDKFSSHYDPTPVREHLSKLPADVVLDWLIPPTYGNTFCPLSERVEQFALLQELTLNPEDHGKALAELLDEALDASNAFNVFIAGCMWVMIEKYLPDAPREEIVLRDVPGFLSIQIPYFALDDRPGGERR